MQCIMKARFDSVDAADRAVSRIRSKVPHLEAKVLNKPRGSLPSEAPYSASMYFPWRINMSVNDRGPLNTELGSRALYTSDLMGLPLYHDGEAEVELKLDAQDVQRTRAMVRNMGGDQIRML